MYAKVLIIGLFFTLGCSKEDDSSTNTDPLAGAVPCDSIHTNRVGARCNDGTSSTATGSGACSHHDGVKYWLCK